MTDLAPHERFGFDTVFDGGGAVALTAARPKRSFSPEEVEAIRKAAFADGESQGLASMAARQAQALSQIADAARAALPTLAEVAHDHRTGSAQLALACAKAIADAALERSPQAPIQAALAALAREIEAAPRLMVTAAPDLVTALEPLLAEVAATIGYPGAIHIRAVEGLGLAAFTLDFGDGAATYDPADAADRVAEALDAALAAEGLHAEPLIPGNEG